MVRRPSGTFGPGFPAPGRLLFPIAIARVTWPLPPGTVAGRSLSPVISG